MKRFFSILITFAFLFIVYKLYFSEQVSEKVAVRQESEIGEVSQENVVKTEIDLKKLEKTESELKSEELKIASLINIPIKNYNNQEQVRSSQVNTVKINTAQINAAPINAAPIKPTEKKVVQVEAVQVKPVQVKPVKVGKAKEVKVLKDVTLNKLQKTESELENEDLELANLMKSNSFTDEKKIANKKMAKKINNKNDSVKNDLAVNKELKNNDLENKKLTANSYYQKESIKKVNLASGIPSDIEDVEEDTDAYNLEVVEKNLVEEEKRLLLAMNNDKQNLQEVEMVAEVEEETKKAYLEVESPELEKVVSIKGQEAQILKPKLIVNKKKKKTAKIKFVKNEFRDPDFFASSFDNEGLVDEAVEVLKVKIASAKAALRAGPGINYPRIKVLLKDSKLKLLQQFERWTKVKDDNGIESWVSNQDLEYE